MTLEILGVPSGAYDTPDGSAHDGWAAMTGVLAELREPDYLNYLTSLLAGELRGTSYESMGADEFWRRMRVNMSELIGGAIQRRPPGAGDDDSRLRAVGAARAGAGVKVSDLVRLILVAQQLLIDETLHRSRSRGIAEEIVIEALQHLDAWMAWETRALITGYREADLAAHARERKRRERAVRRLLTGGLTPAETAEMARDCGLDARNAYLVVCAPTPAGRSVEDVRRMLVTAGLAPFDGGAFTSLHGQLCAILSSVPEEPVPLTVGVSSPVRVGELAAGFRMARRCADAARRLGRTGFVTMRDLSVRASLTVDHEVVRALRARYITPFVEMGATGEAILDTVESYLDHQRSVGATSRALFVHVNTIRYRLSKFESITGCSLREIQTIVEVWWILQSRRF